MKKTCVVVANLELFCELNLMNQIAMNTALKFASVFSDLAPSLFVTKFLTVSFPDSLPQLKKQLLDHDIDTGWVYNSDKYIDDSYEDKTGCLLRASENIPLFRDLAYSKILFCPVSTLLGISGLCAQRWLTTMTRLKINGNQFCLYLDYQEVFGVPKAHLLDALKLFGPIADMVISPGEICQALFGDDLNQYIKQARLMGIKEMLIPCSIDKIILVTPCGENILSKQELIGPLNVDKNDWVAFSAEYMAKKIREENPCV
jgi:hypothetical protein